jgi:hypothetical protein
MSKQKTNRMPNSIDEYGHDHQIWTDKDLALMVSIALAVGFFFGYIARY